MDTLFIEKQRFTQWWLWLLLMVVNILVLNSFVKQIIFGEVVGSRPAPDAVLFIITLLPIGITILFYKVRLVTIITSENISFQFTPFKKSSIKWNEIKTAQIRTYNSLREYGGWGYRIGRNGIAYNIIGNKGLQLELKNGRKILIGTQKAEELQRVLKMLDK